MKVDIQTEPPIGGAPEDMVGNVYQVRGGRGAANGHMHIIISCYEDHTKWDRSSGFATITVNREGVIVGGNSYAHHYFTDKCPIARCDGIEDIQLVVRSL
jgi:hypothetical protein